MKRILNKVAVVSIVLLPCLYINAEDIPQPVTSPDSNDIEILLDCDTVVVENGYAIHLIRDNGEEVFSGLKLFPEDMKQAMDRSLLNRIESDLYKQLKNSNDKKDILTRVVKGSLTDFRSVRPETPCSVSSVNSKYIVAEWNVNGKTVTVEIPVSYETAKGTDRSKTEDLIIDRIRKSDGKRHTMTIDKDILESYGSDLYLLPGGSYHSKDITKNLFLDSSLNPIWDTKYPTESITDLFLYPSDKYGDVEMLLTVLKHEYGEKETISTTVNKVISEFEKDGCIPFWGIEKMADGELEGALFLYNQKQGYDHVLKIECKPEEVINGGGQIKARASLFIPTNNVDNLYSPYTKKSKNEKINYKKK